MKSVSSSGRKDGGSMDGMTKLKDTNDLGVLGKKCNLPVEHT